MAVDRQAIERHVLECNICFELYNDDDRQPRILPCRHTFCISCLRNTWQHGKLVCSKCKADNIVDKVEDLPKDNTRRDLMDILNQRDANSRNVCTSCDEGEVAVAYCQVCEETLCEECTKAHRRMKKTSKHNVIDLSTVESRIRADAAGGMNGEQMKYCLTCDKICEKCSGSCRLVSLDEGYSERVKDLKSQIYELKTKKKSDELEMKRPNEALVQEKDSFLFMKEKLEKLFGDYKAILESRKNTLLGKLNVAHSQNQKVLNQTAEDLSSFHHQSQNAVSLAEKLLKDADKKEFLHAYVSTRDEIGRLQRFKCPNEGIQQLIFTEACTTDDFRRIIDTIGCLTPRSEIGQQPSATGENGAATHVEFNQWVEESFKSHGSPKLMEVLKSIITSGHLYIATTHLPCGNSQSIPGLADQPVQLGNDQVLQTLKQQPLQSVPLPLANTQSFTSDNTRPLPYDINRQILNVHNPQGATSSNQTLIATPTGTSSFSISSFIPLHASPESTVNIEQFTANITVPNMTNAKRQIFESPVYRSLVVARFQTHRLSANWRVQDGETTVYANSVDGAERALHIMQDSVCEKSISVRAETMMLVHSDKWMELERLLIRKYPNQIALDVIHDQNKVAVYSTTSTCLLDVHDAITIFFRENDVKIMLLKFNDKKITSFLLKQKSILKKIMASWSHYCVGVRKYDDVTLEVKGIGVGLGQLVASLYTLARKCTTLVAEEEERFGEDEDADEEEEEDRFENVAIGEVIVELQLGGVDVATKSMSLIGDDRVIYVIHGDVTELPVEAIVSPANEKLRHDGGLAKVLVRKGGRCIQDQCRDFVNQNGALQVGGVMASNAGTLKPQCLLHVVGPKWIDGQKDEESQLEKAVFNSLVEANKRMLISVALPGIGAGAFRFPVGTAVRCIVKAVKDFFLEKPTSSIREVFLVDVSSDIVEQFMKSTQEIYHDGTHILSQASAPQNPAPQISAPQNDVPQNLMPQSPVQQHHIQFLPMPLPK